MAKKTRVLLTGFGPFGEHEINPSAEIVKRVRPPANIKLRKAIIEVNYDKVNQSYLKYLDKRKPDLILNMGYSELAPTLQLEQYAHNRATDSKPESTKTFKVNNQGSRRLRTRVDLPKLVKKICKKNVPAAVSVDAGQYLCNYLYYLSLEWSRKHGSNALFVHVPLYTERAVDLCNQKKKVGPSLELKKMIRATETIIRELRK